MILSGDDTGDGLLYSLIDSTGRVARRLGRRGDGPGEVRGGWTAVSDSSVIVVGQRRLVRYALDGRPLTTITISTDVVPRMAISDSELLGSRGHPSGTAPALVSTVTGRVRDLFAAPDSFLTASFPPGNLFANGPGTQSVAMATLGHWSGGFIVADGWRYHLALYSWDAQLQRILSRSLPPPRLSPARIETELAQAVSYRAARRGMPAPSDVDRMRNEISERRQPYFTHVKSLGLDGQGRIWVIGIDADSGYADVFNPERFLGRIPLPCPGFQPWNWSLRGDWLALACAPAATDTDRDVVFKVFRIVDH